MVIMTKIRAKRPVSKRPASRTSARADHWPVADAKARLSEVIQRAGAKAQMLTVHGKTKAVVISTEEYARLKERRTGKSVIALFDGSPLRDVEFGHAPERSPVRDVDL